MNVRTKFCHFIGAVFETLVGIIIGVVLFIICFLLFRYCNCGENQTIVFLVGIISSLIASIFFNVSVKYKTSCNTFISILDQTEVLLTYLEQINDNNGLLESKQFCFKLWKDIVLIREKSRDLTYQKDFELLSVEYYKIQICIRTNEVGLKPFNNALDGLKCVRNDIVQKCCN